MGIESVGHRIDILSAIQSMKKQQKDKLQQENKDQELKNIEESYKKLEEKTEHLSNDNVSLEKRVEYLETENTKLVKTLNSLNSEFLQLLRKIAINVKEGRQLTTENSSDTSSMTHPVQPSPSVLGSFDLEVNDSLTNAEKNRKLNVNLTYNEVLCSMLQRYRIDPNTWMSYDLLINYDDKEHAIPMDVKPLQLFRNLQKRGKSPSFVLSRRSC